MKITAFEKSNITHWAKQKQQIKFQTQAKSKRRSPWQDSVAKVHFHCKEITISGSNTGQPR